MPDALHRCLCALLVAALPAQQQAPARQDPPRAISQQQQNALRAEAFAAENQGRFAAAADAFSALSKAEPDRVEWAVAAGRCLGQSGRFAEALDLLDAARKRFPDMLELRAILARTLLLRAEREAGILNPEVLWADAAELAESVLLVEPDHEDCRLLLAQARYLLGDRQAAIEHAEEAVRRLPHRPGAHVLLGRIATDRFQTLLAQYQNDRPTGHELANLVAAIDRERQTANRSFRRAAELDPTRAHPHVALSRLALLDGKPEAARQCLLDALAIDPDTAADHDLLTKGMTWQQRRDLYRELRQRYEKATTAEPRKAATLLFHEGRADYEGGDWQAALSCMQGALAANPTATNGHYYGFLSAYNMELLDEAERHAATLAQVSAPAFADTLRSLPSAERAQVALIVQYLGDRAYQQQRIAASRDLNHVIACLKDSADAWNNHAFLCRETGQFEAALASYEHGLEKEPDSPQLWNDAAVILQHHLPTPDNLVRARTMYEKALSLAAAVLADPSSSPKARKFAEGARSDARANLAELPK